MPSHVPSWLSRICSVRLSGLLTLNAEHSTLQAWPQIAEPDGRESQKDEAAGTSADALRAGKPHQVHSMLPYLPKFGEFLKASKLHVCVCTTTDPSQRSMLASQASLVSSCSFVCQHDIGALIKELSCQLGRCKAYRPMYVLQGLKAGAGVVHT